MNWGADTTRYAWKFFELCVVVAVLALAQVARGDILADGIPNLDDERLYAWYDGNEAIGADGVAATPIWPNRQGDPNRNITNGFGGDNVVLTPVPTENGHMALRYTDVVTWRDAGEWGGVFDNFTVFVAATVRDPDFAYFFTGNQPGGGAEANANFQTADFDVWSMKAEFREDTAPLVVDQFQYHSFMYNEDGIGRHYIDGSLAAEVEIGISGLDGFVLGGRQNGAQRASVDFAEVLVYSGLLTDADRMSIEGYLNGKFFGGGLLGDFNDNQELDAGDIDILAKAIRDGSSDNGFDLNQDGKIDGDDHKFWIQDSSVANTYVGDANLDGEFSSTDFVTAFLAGEYETGNPIGWAGGDWNGDGQFQSNDFVAAFLDGGYELGPKPAVNAVPEPASIMLVLIGMLAVRPSVIRRR